MTEQTPATEAGRRLNEKYLTGVDGYAPFTEDILAIEAEARASGDRMARVYRKARADALREAAERVRALPAPKYDGDTWTKDCEHGWDAHEAAVLAILDPQP